MTRNRLASDLVISRASWSDFVNRKKEKLVGTNFRICLKSIWYLFIWHCFHLIFTQATSIHILINSEFLLPSIELIMTGHMP